MTRKKLSLITYFSGVRVFIPNFVRIDEDDFKKNLMKIENAGVLFPMGKFTSILHVFFTVA